MDTTRKVPKYGQKKTHFTLWELRNVLPYLENLSNITITKLAKSVNKNFQLKVTFKTMNKIKKLFHVFILKT